MKEPQLAGGLTPARPPQVKDQYFANSNKCTHYGAPLVKGVLTQEGRLVW